jgi:plastocyanin domain-containing protein
MRYPLLARLGYIAVMSATPALWLSPSTAAVAAEASAVREIEIVVDGGYKPAQVEVRQGERVRLKFVRKEYAGCTREVVIPALGIRRELPPNKVVTIDLPALAPGEYEFRCGMNMVRGAIVVRPS